MSYRFALLDYKCTKFQAQAQQEMHVRKPVAKHWAKVRVGVQISSNFN